MPQLPDGTPAYMDRGVLKARTLIEVKVPNNVEVKGLKSTASTVDPWDGASGTNQGGGTQIYAPDVKANNPQVKPAN